MTQKSGAPVPRAVPKKSHQASAWRYRRSRKPSGRRVSERRTSVTALIVLLILFAVIVSAIAAGVYNSDTAVHVKAAPTFTLEHEPMAYPAADPGYPRIDLTNYAETLDEDFYSESMLLTALDTGLAMAKKNPSQKIYPASLTKIMTTLIGIENMPDLDERYKFTAEMFSILMKAGASRAGFEIDEVVKMRDLLYACMLPSGGEAAMAIAEVVAGSEEAFVELMNQKAAEIGMDNTHYVNCTGLHDDDQYSTVTDITALLEYALQNETFYEVFTCRSYTTSSTRRHYGGLTFSASVFKNMRAAGMTNLYIIGGKTGFTDEAKLCLATLAYDGRFYYICVSTGAGYGDNEPYYNIMDHLEVYDRYLDSSDLPEGGAGVK